MKKLFSAALFAAVLFCSLWLGSCDTGYGTVGGADRTGTYYPADSAFEVLLSRMTGVWYSHYPGIGRLDGYIIGQWKDFDTLVGNKKTLFHNMEPSGITYVKGLSPSPYDYFVMYVDNVYGQSDTDDDPPDGNWGFAYLGIVRAVNLFYDKMGNGAIIIEYVKGCDPEWLWDLDGFAYQGLQIGEMPFFGIYYRLVKGDWDVIQMANAVDLAALSEGRYYYTETKTLAEAVQKNNVMNEREFIAWGVVIPQDREK